MQRDEPCEILFQLLFQSKQASKTTVLPTTKILFSIKSTDIYKKI